MPTTAQHLHDPRERQELYSHEHTLTCTPVLYIEVEAEPEERRPEKSHFVPLFACHIRCKSCGVVRHAN